MKRITRRAALQLAAAAPVAAAMAWTPAEAEQAHHDAQQARTTAAKTGTAFSRSFSRRTNTPRLVCWWI
jgi:hypothetical protein